MCSIGSTDADYNNVYSNIFTITNPCRTSDASAYIADSFESFDNYICRTKAFFEADGSKCYCPYGHIAYLGFVTSVGGYSVLDRNQHYVQKAMDSSNEIDCSESAFG
jgi:hypothetical protein